MLFEQTDDLQLAIVLSSYCGFAVEHVYSNPHRFLCYFSPHRDNLTVYRTPGFFTLALQSNRLRNPLILTRSKPNQRTAPSPTNQQFHPRLYPCMYPLPKPPLRRRRYQKRGTSRLTSRVPSITKQNRWSGRNT